MKPRQKDSQFRPSATLTGRLLPSLLAWSLLGALGCSQEQAADCPVVPDADGDRIPDVWEGDRDPDADGVPNRLDLDSDGDGYSDAEEARLFRRGEECIPTDTDKDGLFDFEDADSDADGLVDARERLRGTDPRLSDTDGDDVPDLVEVEGSGTDPLDPASTLDLERNFFVVLPFEGPEDRRSLRFSTTIRSLDVLFLVDTTATMAGERTQLIEGVLEDVVPGIVAEIPDVQFGVASFEDYPVSPYGLAADRPFTLLREIAPPELDIGTWSVPLIGTDCPPSPEGDFFRIGGNGVPDLLEALRALPCHDGGDQAEAVVPALFAVATGAGLTWNGGAIPSRRCADATRQGYPCFREGVMPVVVLVGDSRSHNGPQGTASYNFAAPDYGETRDALTALGIRVIGLHSGTDSRDYVALAEDTGAVREDGTPLVFPISPTGEGLSGAAVRAVAELAQRGAVDVTTRTSTLVGNPGDFDASALVTAVRPLEGFRNGVPGGYERITETGFLGMQSGTEVEFEVRFENRVRRADRVEVHRAKIDVLGNRSTVLDDRQVYILIPATGQTILI